MTTKSSMSTRPSRLQRMLARGAGWVQNIRSGRALVRRAAGLIHPGLIIKKGPGCRIDRTARFAGVLENIELGRNVVIGNDAFIFCNRREARIRIGDNVQIGPYTRLEASTDRSIEIGSNCSINAFSILYGHGGIAIGTGVRIAAQTIIVSHNHNFRRADLTIKEQGITAEPVRVGNDVWLGAGCKIMAGVTVADGCVVGAGAVVTRDIPPMSIAVGVPARVIGRRGAGDILARSEAAEPGALVGRSCPF